MLGVEQRRIGIEDQLPRPVLDDHPYGVLSLWHGVAVHRHVLRERQRRGQVRARRPHLAPVDGRAEDAGSTRARGRA